MLFMIKGELLINSEEYPGNILREKQFILQAIGSKIELLALTDVDKFFYGKRNFFFHLCLSRKLTAPL